MNECLNLIQKGHMENLLKPDMNTLIFKKKETWSEWDQSTARPDIQG